RSAIGIDCFLIMEGDWLEAVNDFARRVHRLDVIFEAGRGNDRAQLTIISYKHCRTPYGGLPTDALYIHRLLNRKLADPNRVGLGGNTWTTDIDVVATRSEVNAGTCA